jgi:predicted O-methyltransferase YrrM
MLGRLKKALMSHRREVCPVKARHVERSFLFSADDAPGHPSPALIDLGLQAANRAGTIDLRRVSDRVPAGQVRYPDVWPGEHYRLLGALVDLLRPRNVLEIGTGQGLSALAMLQYLPPEGHLATFDLVRWDKCAGTRMTAADFVDGRLAQYVDDLSDPAVFARHAELLQTADLVFLDAAKDGRLEQALLDNFSGLSFAKPPLFILDDIRLKNMVKVWRDIGRPKLDLTSFGHWSGTGLVEWL